MPRISAMPATGTDGGTTECGRERDEVRTGDALQHLGAQHGNEQQENLFTEGQVDTRCLCDEEGSKRHVDVPVPSEVEGVAGRNDETGRQKRLQPAFFHLAHQARKGCFRRRRAENEQQLFLDVADQRQDGEAVSGRQHPE